MTDAPRLQFAHDPAALIAALLHDTHDAAAVVGADGLVVQVLRAITPQGRGLAGQPFDRMLDEEQRRTLSRPALAEALRTGEAVQFEVPGPDLAGRMGWYRTRLLRVPGSDPPLAVALVQDTTAEHARVAELEAREARLAEAVTALRRSEARFRTLFEHLPAPATTVGRDLRFRQVNRLAPGVTEAWLRERSALDYCAPEQREAVRGLLEDTFATGTPHTYETHARHSDGSEHTYLVTAARLPEQPGEETELLLITTEITDRVRVEEEKARLTDQLLQAQKMEVLGQLAGGLAHDFNNLLLVIQSHLSFARDTLGDDPRVDADLTAIETAAGRAGELTRQLLAVARQQRFEVGPVDLDALIDEAFGLLRRTLPAGITLDHRRSDPPLAVLGNAGQLHQVLINLAVNAHQAMPDGGALRFRVHRGAPGEVELEVTDTGHGMTPEIQARIFEPFFSGRAGTGLGLAMVNGIVRQHGGRIAVSSTPGRGTTFRLSLPEAPVRPEPAAPRPAPALAGGETVLVAEDQEPVRRLVVRVLSQAGYRVLEAADGLEAVRLAEAHADTLDLVVLDVVMPGLTGRQVYERLAPAHPRLKFLLTSGFSAGELPEGFVDAHHLAILAKPYLPATLLRQVRTVLDRRG